MAKTGMKVGHLELKKNSYVWQIPRIPFASKKNCSREWTKASFILISWAAGCQSHHVCYSLSILEAFGSSPSCLPVPTVVLFHQRTIAKVSQYCAGIETPLKSCSLTAQPVISLTGKHATHLFKSSFVAVWFSLMWGGLCLMLQSPMAKQS